MCFLPKACPLIPIRKVIPRYKNVDPAIWKLKPNFKEIEQTAICMMTIDPWAIAWAVMTSIVFMPATRALASVPIFISFMKSKADIPMGIKNIMLKGKSKSVR